MQITTIQIRSLICSICKCKWLFKKSVGCAVHLFVGIYCCFIQTMCINTSWKCNYGQMPVLSGKIRFDPFSTTPENFSAKIPIKYSKNGRNTLSMSNPLSVHVRFSFPLSYHAFIHVDPIFSTTPTSFLYVTLFAWEGKNERQGVRKTETDIQKQKGNSGG